MEVGEGANADAVAVTVEVAVTVMSAMTFELVPVLN
jgi:hypothetical protein